MSNRKIDYNSIFNSDTTNINELKSLLSKEKNEKKREKIKKQIDKLVKESRKKWFDDIDDISIDSVSFDSSDFKYSEDYVKQDVLNIPDVRRAEYEYVQKNKHINKVPPATSMETSQRLFDRMMCNVDFIDNVHDQKIHRPFSENNNRQLGQRKNIY